VSTEKRRFTIRASASRLDKGLLAIPQRSKDWFSGQKRQILVIFNDEETPRALTFHPFDPVVKENRIFGLAPWFSKRGVREGDIISMKIDSYRARSQYEVPLPMAPVSSTCAGQDSGLSRNS
jgi:hypothetical protein